MASSDKDSSLICSLILEKSAVNYSTSLYTGIYVCFVFAASTQVLQGFLCFPADVL